MTNFANKYAARLAAYILDDALTCTVASATGAPAVPFNAMIERKGAFPDEIVTVTNVTGSVLTITRASEAVAGVQTAYDHPVGAVLRHIVTADAFAEIDTAITAASTAAETSETVMGKYVHAVLNTSGLTAYYRFNEPAGYTARNAVQSTLAETLSDAYGSKGTAALGAPDDGPGAWSLVQNDAEAALSVIGGKLTNAADDEAVRAGYASMNMVSKVTRIGGSFTLSATSNPGGGVAAFCVWRTPLLSSATIPDASLHLIVSDISWALSVWENGSPADVAGGGGSFASALATDGTTVHTVDVTISGSTVTITLPDASTHVLGDPRIARLAGQHACFEIYQSNALVDTKVGFTEVWAEASSNANDGMFSGLTGLEPTLGVAGLIAGSTDKAVQFNTAQPDMMTVPHATAVKPPGAITAMGWIKSSAAGYMDIVRTDRYLLRMQTGTGVPLAGVTDAGGYKLLFGTTNLADGAVHFAAMTADGSSLRLYIDGVPEGDAVACLAPAYDTSNLTIGNADGSDYTTAVIQHVAIFGRALTSAEIAELYVIGQGLT